MMLIRVTYCLFTFIILGCAEDSINQITKKDSIEIKTVDSNDSDRVTTQVEKEGLKIPEAAVPKVVLKKKTLTSPKVWRHSNEPKNSTEDDDKLELEPVPVVEELVGIRSALFRLSRQKKRSNYYIQANLPSLLHHVLIKILVFIRECLL